MNEQELAKINLLLAEAYLELQRALADLNHTDPLNAMRVENALQFIEEYIRREIFS